MINLLSDERKDGIRAARANVILSRYIAIILMATAFMYGVLYVSYTVLERTKSSNDAIIQSNDLKADVYSDTRSQIDTLASKLAETKSTLDQEVRYSHVLTTIGQLMPAGTFLDPLVLSDASFNGAPVELTVYAKTADAAPIVRDNFQASPLFSSVTLKGTDPANGSDGYPVNISLTVVFNRAGAK